MMIQNTTFLRRAVGSLLVALVALVGFQSHGQAVDFTASADFTFAEQDGNGGTVIFEGGTDEGSVAALNARIAEALPTNSDDYCYQVSGVSELELVETSGTADCRADGKAVDATNTANGRTGVITVQLKTDRHLDADPITKGSKDRTLTITGHADGKAKGTLTVNITVKNFDEQPKSTQNTTDNRVPVWYLSDGDSKSILISSVFSDPEGAPVYFNAGGGSTDVYVCDSDTAGSRQPTSSDADDNLYAAAPDGVPTVNAGTTGGTGTTACSVSNENRHTVSPTDDTVLVAPTTGAANGAPGTAGNRVVTTRKVGPILHISANSVVTDTDADPLTVGTTPRPKGTYTATVLFRVWTGAPPNRRASRDWSRATVHVKIGANNLPQFAGGATGYTAEINESDSGQPAARRVTSTERTTAWVAGDLDSNGVNNDSLTYSLEGQVWNRDLSNFVVGAAGGAVWVNQPTTEGISLGAWGIDFEKATSFTVNLEVTDRWSEKVSVPITVTVKNVNELNYAKDGDDDKKIEDQNMVNGLKRTFDLDDYFVDPEKDTITYTAHTNIYTDVVSLGEGNVLTVTGGHATETTDSEVTVTVTASDGKGGLLSHDFVVTTRHANDAPAISLRAGGTVAIGETVDENGDKGEVVASIAYTDDGPAPKAELTGDASHFKATVDDKKKMVSITVDEPLDFETALRHVLQLQLIDSWEPDKKSKKLEIQVTVVDQNDAPNIVEGMEEIADQAIVVNGSKKLSTGDHFEDQDNDRLLVNASSSDMTKVSVSVSGLSDVTFSGLAQTEEDMPVTVTLTATDPDGDSATLTFNVSVGANNPPEKSDATFAERLPADNTVNVGGFADIKLDGLFTEPDGGDSITSITASSSDSSILMVIVEDGTATLVGRNSGEAKLTITAMDMGGNSTSVDEDITVNAAPEEATPLDPQTLDRVTPHVVDVSGVFTDSDDGDDSLTITAEAVGDGMDRVTLGVEGFDLTITGVAGIEPGNVEIVLRATDPHGDTAKSTFVATTINIDPTVANSVDAQELDRLNPITVDVSEVFTDIDGDISTITASVPDDAIITVGDIDVADGQLMVSALEDVGSATVTLEATDNNGGMVTDTFMVTVNNILPTVAEGMSIEAQTLDRVDPLMVNVSGVFADSDGEITAITASVPDDSVVGVGMIDIEDGMLTVTGLTLGDGTVTLEATDNNGGMVTDTFMVTVVNVAPTVAESVEAKEFTRIDPLMVDVSGVFADVDGEISSITASVPEGAVVSVGEIDLMSGMLTVTGLALGEATVTLEATDNDGGMVTDTFMVTVNNVAPTVAMSIEAQAFTRIDPLMVDVSGVFADADGEISSIIASVPEDAVVSVGEIDLMNGMLTVTGLAVGDATITLAATDNDGGMITDTFMVTVDNVDPVVANAIMDQTTTRTMDLVVDIGQTFSDPDTDEELTLTVAVDNDMIASAMVDGNILRIDGLDVGLTTLTVTAEDNDGGSISNDFVLEVQNIKPTVAMNISDMSFDRLAPLGIDLSGTFADDDGMISTVTAEVGNELLVDAMIMDSTLTLTALAVGRTTVTLTAVDDNGGDVMTDFVIEVVNIEPVVANAVADQTTTRIADLSIDISETFDDPDQDNSLLSISVTVENEVTVDAMLDGHMLMISGLDVGNTNVTLTAVDEDGGTVSNTFMTTIENVEPVVANAVADQTTTRIADLSIDISETFDDPDQDNNLLSISVTVGNDMTVDAMLDGHMLMISGLDVGYTNVTLTAVDEDGGTVSNTFMTTIENVEPVVANAIPVQSTTRIADLSIDISETFDDPDQDNRLLSISVAVADDMIVGAMLDGHTLTISGLDVGYSNVTLTAVDEDGGMVSNTFMTTIENVGPVVANAVADQSTTRVEDLMFDISSNFDDPDQDNNLLAFSVSVEDDTIVGAMLDGSMLTLNGLEVGATSVTVTATDEDGHAVSTTFVTTINNVDPVVANSVADQEMDRRAPLTLDLSDTFLDVDDGAPAITVMIRSGAVLAAGEITDMTLELTALAVGETAVTLTATDVNGASVSDEFNVTVINIEPVVANAVADQTTTRVDDLSIDVSSTFDDPDQDNSYLSITVSVADSTYVDASLSGLTLMISGLDVGSTAVTLTATDADGGMVENTFTTTIDNIAPVVANSISPINLEVGGQAASQAIAGLFSDDGDPLSYSISSANSGIASAMITGTTAMIGPVSRGSTNFTITATDPHGGSASVTGSVTVGDGELKAVAAKSLAGFGRAMLASVSSSVGSRVMMDARSSDLTLDAWAPVENQGAMAMNMTADERSDAAWNVVNSTTNMPVSSTATAHSAAHGGQMSSLSALGSMFGQNFALNLGSSDNPSRWSVWGDIDRQSYEGAGYDGIASSVYLGADVTVAECWMFGVAISSNSGESDYSWGTATQTMDLSLTTVLPYISYQPTNGSSIWGVAGFGSGELDTTVVGASNDVSDLSSTLTMVGGSQELTTVGRLNLALRGDAATVSLETEDGNGAADGLAADVNRIRIGLEGSFRTETGQGGMLEPFGQINLRSDGGDGDTGTGIEVAGGVRMTSNVFTLEVQGRTLAMHGADEYSESGLSLMAKLNPSASATGVSVSIAPRWGADALGNGMLWQDTLNIGSANTYGMLTGFGNAGASKSIDTQIGYGFMVANEQYLLTPFVDYGVSDSDRRELLLGASLRQLAQNDAMLDINLALGRVEERTGARSGKIGLNATLRF